MLSEVMQTINSLSNELFMIAAENRECLIRDGKKIFVYDNTNTSRFNEIARMMEISHPNIASPVYYGQKKCYRQQNNDPEFFYFLVFSGQFNDDILYNLLRSKKLVFQTKIQLFRQILDAVIYSHQHGIFHLDIRLESIGFAKVNNKLMLKIRSCYDNTIYENKDLFKNYFPPEIIEHKNYDKENADTYILGICLLYLLTDCELSIFGINECLMVLFHSNQSKYWEWFDIVYGLKNFGLSPELIEIISGMTRQNPFSRITLEDVKNALSFLE